MQDALNPAEPQATPPSGLPPAQRATACYSDILRESERRFDEAFDALDDGDGAT
jgi:hypothetical protein